MHCGCGGATAKAASLKIDYNTDAGTGPAYHGGGATALPDMDIILRFLGQLADKQMYLESQDGAEDVSLQLRGMADSLGMGVHPGGANIHSDKDEDDDDSVDEDSMRVDGMETQSYYGQSEADGSDTSVMILGTAKQGAVPHKLRDKHKVGIDACGASLPRFHHLPSLISITRIFPRMELPLSQQNLANFTLTTDSIHLCHTGFHWRHSA